LKNREGALPLVFGVSGVGNQWRRGRWHGFEDVNSGRIGQAAILGMQVPHVSEATSALFPPIGPHDINIILLLGAADADNSSVGLSAILDGQIGEERSVWGRC